MKNRSAIWLCLMILVIAQFGTAQNSTFMRLAKVPGLNFGLSFTETTDGGMIGTGQDDGAGGHGVCDLFVHKIDECGVTEWYKRYGGPAEDGGKFVTQLADGGYAIGGLSTSSGAGGYDLWLLRLDGSGNLIWSKTFGAGAGDHGRCAAQAPNGDLLLCGFRNAHRPVVYRVDLNGNIVWQKEFDLVGGICNYVEFFPNGDVLAIGDFVGPYGGRDVFAARLDGAGNLIWANQMGTGGEDGIDWDVAGKIGGGGFILSATMSGFGTDQDMTISRFDGNGGLQWRKRLYGAGIDKAHFVNQTDDGGYIQSGTTNSWGFGNYDVLVNRFDGTGNHLWTKLYGGAGIDKGWGVQQTSDNGYLLSTLTTSFGALYYDPMFIKTDSVGGLIDCPNIQTPPITVADANYSLASFSFNIYDVDHFTSDYSPTAIDIVPDDELVCFSCVNEPEFIISDSVICQGESLYLINQTSVGLVCSQEWFIEDSLGANVSALPGADTAVYSFQNPGFYNIVLNANCGGIINSDTLTILVLPKPIPGFEFADACMNEQPITVLDTSLIYPSIWDWDFGDGTTGSGVNVQHSYADSGTYDIQLVVTNFFQCSDTIVQQIRIHNKPNAVFIFNDTCLGGVNNFIDQSVANDGVIATYDWTFGEGGVSNQQQPNYTYANSGTYDVQLVVTTDNGCTDTLLQEVDSYALPQAGFDFPINCINDAISLTDASQQGDWPISSWNWTLDGSTVLSGSNVQHVFPSIGSYPVQLLVTDQFGCVDSLEQDVTVSPRPQISISVMGDCEDEQFLFTNNSSITSGIIDSVHWDMDDGNTFNDVSPINIYTVFGIYDVVLYLESELGCESDTGFQVEVYPNPVADMNWSNICDGSVLPINELSSVVAPGQLLLSDWNMGDGNLLNDTSFSSYSYSTYGSYTIQLSVETQHSCTDVQAFPVHIHAVPEADFSFIDICETDSSIYVDQSSIADGGIVLWEWDFGNGQVYDGQTPSYQVYPADNFYAVQLTVTSDSGCVSVFNDTIEIFPSPLADYIFDSTCFPLPIQFTDLTDVNGSYPLTNWSWEFTDGQTSPNQSPLVDFGSFGAYGATLVVTNAAGCKDEISLGDALVHPLPEADYMTDLAHCNNDTMFLEDNSTVVTLSDDAIVSWLYTLEDGNLLSEPDTYHVYNSPGFYDVELLVITNHGCQDTRTQEVEIYPLPEVDFDVDPKEGCRPLFVQFTDETTILSPYMLGQWQWNLGDSAGIAGIPNPSYVYNPLSLPPNDFATYDISLAVTSTDGCISSISYPELITVHPLPNALFSTDPTKIASIIRPIFDFTDLSTENVIDWKWTFGDGEGSFEQDPTHTYPDTGSYSIQLIVETSFGCADTISYTVKVEPLFTFYIPNAFSPNNDGVNDFFYGQGENISQYNMQVFDRWGERIFETDNPTTSWDGTYQGKHVEMGQYVYKFYILDWQGHDHEYIGSVMLLR